jgi:hypothetical protein
MSFSVVWFGVNGKDKSAFLNEAGYRDTGEADEFCDAEVSGAHYPSGWYVLVGGDVEMFDVDRLRALSHEARLVAVVSNEDTLTSIATEWVNGEPVWSISHEPSDGDPTITVEGALPVEFEAVRRTYLEKLNGDSTVELAFEVPVDVAHRITGFRHDMIGFEENGPVFTRLEEG